MRKESLYLIKEFTAGEMQEIAKLKNNEAFYTLVNLINARMKIKHDDFMKYPEELWKMIHVIYDYAGEEIRKPLEVDLNKK